MTSVPPPDPDAEAIDSYLDHLHRSEVRGVPADAEGRAALVADFAHLRTEARAWWADQPIAPMRKTP